MNCKYRLPYPLGEVTIEGAKRVPTRVTYVCPHCQTRVMGKRGITSLACNCVGGWTPLEEVTEATATPATPTAIAA